MKIPEYLHACQKLVRFCSQNGWIDNESLRYTILEFEDGAVVATIEFEEIVMEGSGSIAARVPCWGRMRIYLDEDGEVRGSELV